MKTSVPCPRNWKFHKKDFPSGIQSAILFCLLPARLPDFPLYFTFVSLPQKANIFLTEKTTFARNQCRANTDHEPSVFMVRQRFSAAPFGTIAILGPQRGTKDISVCYRMRKRCHARNVIQGKKSGLIVAVAGSLMKFSDSPCSFHEDSRTAGQSTKASVQQHSSPELR